MSQVKPRAGVLDTLLPRPYSSNKLIREIFMSNDTNTQLLQRAANLIDALDSHPSGLQKHLVKAVETNDLDEVQYWVPILEAELSQINFMDGDIL